MALVNEKKKSLHHKKRNDIILIVAIVLVALLGLLVMNKTKTKGYAVEISIDGVVAEQYPLDKDMEKMLFTDGKAGENMLVIKNGEAYISYANCPDGICSEHKAVSYVGESIICLPHKLVVEVVPLTTGSGLDIVV